MNETLPISIKVNEELVQRLTKVVAVTNKLEAQFNFQTLAANWYGDEDNIHSILLRLESAASFESNWQVFEENSSMKQYSDDVFSITNSESKLFQTVCYIAITTVELMLVTEQTKLLPALLQVKLQKVLNLIAKKHALTCI